MKYLLDTNVISELISRRPDPKVVAWIDGLDPDAVYLSVITIGEIQKGVEKLTDTQRRRTIQEWLHNDLLLRFQGRIIPITTSVAITWGKLTAALERDGRSLPAIDSLVAAIAREGGIRPGHAQRQGLCRRWHTGH